MNKIIGLIAASTIAIVFTGCGSDYDDKFILEKVSQSGPFKTKAVDYDIIHEAKKGDYVQLSLNVTYQNTSPDKYLCEFEKKNRGLNIMSGKYSMYSGHTNSEEECEKRSKGKILASPGDEIDEPYQKDIRFSMASYKKWEAKQ